MQVLRMFYKKVHPERSTAEEFTKSHNCEIEKCSINGGCNKGNLTLQGQHNRALFNKEITNINPTNKRLNRSGLTQKREHWIKTDADCKYKSTSISCFINISIKIIQEHLLSDTIKDK